MNKIVLAEKREQGISGKPRQESEDGDLGKGLGCRSGNGTEQ